MPVAGNVVRASDIPIRGGVTLRRVANQAISTTTATLVSWDTQDEDVGGYWASGTTITIPTDYDGIYVATFRGGMILTASPRSFADLTIVSSVTGVPGDFRHDIGASEARLTTHYSGPLAAGDTVQATVFQQTGSTQQLTAWISLYRVSL